MRRHLADLTWPEVAELARGGAVLAVPVGATEQHGPHLPLSTDTDVACALADLLADRRVDVVAWGPHWGGDAHAGRTETSVQLALDPRRVRVAESAAGQTDPVAGLMPALLAGGVRAVSPNGVLGDPAGASASEGRKLLDAAADALCDRVRSWLGSRTCP